MSTSTTIDVARGGMTALPMPTRVRVREALQREGLTLATEQCGDSWWFEITPTLWARVRVRRGFRRVA